MFGTQCEELPPDRVLSGSMWPKTLPSSDGQKVVRVPKGSQVFAKDTDLPRIHATASRWEQANSQQSTEGESLARGCEPMKRSGDASFPRGFARRIPVFKRHGGRLNPRKDGLGVLPGSE